MFLTNGPGDGLVAELETLQRRVEAMERLIRGAGATLTAVVEGEFLEYTGDDERRRTKHALGMEMLEFLTEQIAAWRAAEFDHDFAFDDLDQLLEWARDGRLTYQEKQRAAA